MLRQGHPGRGAVINPIGTVLKNIDKVRAEVLVGVHIVDQATLQDASDKLVAAGFPKVKVRVATDMTASGVNDLALTPPLRYPGIEDGIRMVQRGDYFAKGGVTR